ncbi:MAG: hypothetical protein ACFKPT_10305 [Gloeotrichia echinulata GP01]
MNVKIMALLAIMVACTSLEVPVQAQSPASGSNSRNYLLTGDSLMGIDHRTAQKDFGRFSQQQNAGSTSSNSNENNRNPEELTFQESLSLPKSPIFLQPAQAVNGNDGLQVQLDLVNGTK